MICRFCGKNINSFRFCGICGKQNPIILKWNNYEECDEIKEVSDYLKSVPLPYANKYRENINRKPDVEKKEEIKPIENKPQNSNKVENAVPKLNDNIPKGKAYSNKNNQKKSNNLWKRKYLILSVFVGVVVLAVGTIAAISLNSNKNDKDRNDKSEVDSESIDTSDVEKSTSVNLENSSDKESTETSESESESTNESIETSETSSTETNEEARKNKTKTDIEGTYYSASDVYKCLNFKKDTFDMFDGDILFNGMDMRYVELNDNAKARNLKYYNVEVDLNFKNFDKNGSVTLGESFKKIDEDKKVDEDFISSFEYNKFVQERSYEDKSVNDKDMYFFKLKNKNTNVTLMCNKLNDLHYNNDKGKFVFDIIDGKDNHLECNKKMDNNFEICFYHGAKGDNKKTGDGKGEVLKDHYIGKYMIARLEIYNKDDNENKNWFLLRDYNDKSSVYVVQYIKYND